MEQLTGLLAQYGLALVFANVLLTQLGAPVPAIPTLIVAGALAQDGQLSAAAALVVAVAASLAGDLPWFAAGRAYGHRVLGALCRIAIEPDSCVKQTEDRFGRWGASSLMFAKFVPGFATVAPPIAGALRLGLTPFLAYSAVGAALWAGAALAAGMIFHAQVDWLLDWIESMGSGAAVALGLALGFYITGHPLERVQDVLGRLSITTIQALSEAQDDAEVTIAGLVMSKKITTTRRGDRMAYARIEDLTGTLEAIIFPELFKSHAAVLDSDEPVIITGTLDRGDQGSKLKSTRLQSLAEVQARVNRQMRITLGPSALSVDQLVQLRAVLARHQGPCPVAVTLRHPAQREATILVDRQYWVTPTPALQADIEALCGAGALTIQAAALT